MSWVRLWSDMPTDPKWRVIAKRANRPLAEVMSVFVLMMTNAGANATERGELCNWSDEDAAAALDIEPSAVTAIREAMQGKTLEGEKLTGWEKRQPKREDGSAERARAWRERNRTQPNAPKRPDSDADSDSEKDNNRPVRSEQEAAPAKADGASEISGLNGSTSEIVTGIAKFLNVHCPDQDAARRIVASNVGLYGSDAVRDGYAELMADVADNKVRVPSVKALVGYFKTAGDRRDKPRRDQSNRPQWAVERDDQLAKFKAALKTYQ